MATSPTSKPSYLSDLETAMKGMIRKASEVLSATAGLYREMTVSALRLVPRRH